MYQQQSLQEVDRLGNKREIEVTVLLSHKNVAYNMHGPLHEFYTCSNHAHHKQQTTPVGCV